jgi:pheromone a factor receptor
MSYRPYLNVSLATRVTVAVNVGVPAAALCITRRLYKIASVQSATITRRERRRAVTVDLWIGLGIPLVQQLMCKLY